MNFEAKLQKTFSSKSEILDPDQFINKLTSARYAQALKRSQAISGYLALIVVLFVGILYIVFFLFVNIICLHKIERVPTCRLPGSSVMGAPRY